MNEVNESCFKKKSSKPINKIAGLTLYETLSYIIGKAFEPYLQNVIDNILQSFADPKEEVRAASKTAMKAVMG